MPPVALGVSVTAGYPRAAEEETRKEEERERVGLVLEMDSVIGVKLEMREEEEEERFGFLWRKIVEGK